MGFAAGRARSARRFHRAVIRMSDVSMEYDNGVRAVKRATLRIDEGEFVFLVGPSGSGKSTLIKLITGEVRPTAGRIVVNNYNMSAIKKREIPYLRRTLGVVFQDFRLIEKKTVYENVAFAMRAVGANNRAIKKRVPYVLDLVGLADKADTRPLELSGGEQQRVAIARALVNNPRLIIADEPTGNLDPVRSYELMTLFEKINELGTTILIVTHEKELVDEFEKRVIMIDDGVIVSDATGRYFADDEYDEYYEEGGDEPADNEPEEPVAAPLAMLFDRFSLRKSNAQDDETDEIPQEDGQPEEAPDELPPEPVEEEEIPVPPQEEQEVPAAEEMPAAPEPPAEAFLEAVPEEEPAPEAVEEPEEIPDEPAETGDVQAPEAAGESGDALDDLSLAELVDRFQRRVGIPSVEDIIAEPQNEENNADGEGEHEQTNEETETPEQQDRN